jgi:hypothetical protein
MKGTHEGPGGRDGKCIPNLERAKSKLGQAMRAWYEAWCRELLKNFKKGN